MAGVFRKSTTCPLPKHAKITVNTDGSQNAHWTDRSGRKLSSRVMTSPRGPRVSIDSTKWYGRVNGKDVPLSRDKKVAEQTLRSMEIDIVKAGVGLGPSDATASRRTIIEHIADFETVLRAKGVTLKHARHVSARLQAVCEGLNWQKLTDIHAPAAGQWIAALGYSEAAVQVPESPDGYRPGEAAAVLGISLQALSMTITRNALEAGTGNGKARRIPTATVQAIFDRRERGISPRTRNDYRIHLKHFGKWLEESGRVLRNPFRHGLSAENTSIDIRCRRRALSEAELTQLLDVTQTGPSRAGLTGHERRMLYLVAYVTGFRASALAALTPAQFDLRAEPTVTLTARSSKNRKSQVNPIPTYLVEPLRQYLAGHSRTQPVWPGKWSQKAVTMFRKDLLAAKIPLMTHDAHGELKLDFHSLRHTSLTHVARSVPLHVAQKLAGHSSPLVTARYTHADAADLRAAVEKLVPGYSSNSSLIDAPIICTLFAQTGVAGGHFGSVSDNGVSGIDGLLSPSQILEKIGFKGAFGGDLESAPSRTRTLNPLIKSQLLCQLS